MFGQKKLLHKSRKRRKLVTVPQMSVKMGKTNQRGAVRIRGIVRMSEAFQVTRQHLRLVVLGERKSPALLARFHRWQANNKISTQADYG